MKHRDKSYYYHTYITFGVNFKKQIKIGGIKMRINKYLTYLDDNKMPYLVKEKGINYLDECLSPQSIAALCNHVFDSDKVAEEHVYLLCFTAKNCINGVFEISIGTITSSIVPFRELFQKALLCGAANIAIAHNHPSGNPSPSADDVKVTQRIKEMCNLIGIRYMDHIIIGDNGRYYSFKEPDY